MRKHVIPVLSAELLEVVYTACHVPLYDGKVAWRPEDKSALYLFGPTWLVSDVYKMLVTRFKSTVE